MAAIGPPTLLALLLVLTLGPMGVLGVAPGGPLDPADRAASYYLRSSTRVAQLAWQRFRIRKTANVEIACARVMRVSMCCCSCDISVLRDGVIRAFDAYDLRKYTLEENSCDRDGIREDSFDDLSFLTGCNLDLPNKGIETWLN